LVKNKLKFASEQNSLSSKYLSIFLLFSSTIRTPRLQIAFATIALPLTLIQPKMLSPNIFDSTRIQRILRSATGIFVARYYYSAFRLMTSH